MFYGSNTFISFTHLKIIIWLFALFLPCVLYVLLTC